MNTQMPIKMNILCLIKKFNWDFLSKDMVAPTKAKVKSAVDMGNNIVALEFDSEVLVNQAPVLKLANGNLATS